MIEMVDLYALDALEGPEVSEFEAHLGECALCRSQLDECYAVTATLVADSDPPNHVWDRIAAEIDPTWATVHQFPQRRWVVFTLSAVAAALAITLGAVLLTNDNLSPAQAIAAAAERAAVQPGATVSTFVVDDLTVAEVILTTEGAGYLVPTDDMVDLDESRTYQLWVINDDGAVISGGVLGHSPEVSSFTWADGASGLALTREIAGGVPVSEGDVVAVISDL